MTVAVGFFDGVHLGHRAILSGADAVLTFRNHPLSVLAPARAPKLMMSLDERLTAIRRLGVADVTALDFTPELAALSPSAFAARHLSAYGDAVTLRCGANWHFGKDGAGDAAWLSSHGYQVSVVPFAEFDGAPISSSRIRAALARGEIAAAAAMLGRNLVLSGERVEGKGEGTRLGFPTVNLKIASPLAALLPQGVYAVEVASGVRAIANFGLAPTFGSRRWSAPVLEVHFPNQSAAPAAWTDGTVTLVRFIRPERTFATLDDLRHQIAFDCASINIS